MFYFLLLVLWGVGNCLKLFCIRQFLMWLNVELSCPSCYPPDNGVTLSSSPIQQLSNSQHPVKTCRSLALCHQFGEGETSQVPALKALSFALHYSLSKTCFISKEKSSLLCYRFVSAIKLLRRQRSCLTCVITSEIVQSVFYDFY